MSTKLAIVLLVLLALLFSVGMGAVALREKDEDPDPGQPQPLAEAFDSVMGFFAPALDLGELKVVSGTRGVIKSRMLTIKSGNLKPDCLLEVARNDDEDLRVVEIELLTEGKVTVVSWEKKKTSDHEPIRLERGKPMRLAFRARGGRVEINVTAAATCKIRFVDS